jgi:hypothetical protein
LTAPGGGTVLSAGSFDRPKAHAVHLGRKISSAVRPNNDDGGYNEKKPLPRRAGDEETGDAESMEDYEQATALHGCMYYYNMNMKGFNDILIYR